MTTDVQHEVLRLANALENDLVGYDRMSIPRTCQDIADKSAAELRRLHEENVQMREQRDELLEVLIDMVDHYGTASANVQQLDAAKSAIAKATGETK